VPAKDHLSDYQFRYRPTGPQNTRGYSNNSGEPDYNHEIHVRQMPSKDVIASMKYQEPDGGVHLIDVDTEHQGRGIATAMWNKGHAIAKASKGKIPAPMHLEGGQTDEGEGWKSYVGSAPKEHTKSSTPRRTDYSTGAVITPWGGT